MIEAAIRCIEAGQDLSTEEMAQTIGAVIEGRPADDQMARFLLTLNRKGPTVAEVAGAATAMRRKMTPIRSDRAPLLDTCGTGGDGLGTFNISTAAALVIAAAGVPVAKHGNRAASSRSGSADVLAALGVNVGAGVATVERCLAELGICFCYAPLLHPAMERVAVVRKRLGVPTIFNLLGPLANPAAAPFQLLGVGRPELQPLLAETLALLGTQRSLVVHGSDGLDEVTLSGPTYVMETNGDRVRGFQWLPGDFGLPTTSLAGMRVSTPSESAAMVREVLAGNAGPARDIVVANAAAGLWIAGLDPSPEGCARQAEQAILTGQARKLLDRLVAITNGQAVAD
jgi:anthranilate phosphoribosyltransferase